MIVEQLLITTCNTYTHLSPPHLSLSLSLTTFANSEFIADLETPVSTLLKVRAHYETSGFPGHCFLLESVEGGERVARFSFVGAGPRRVIVCGGETSSTAESGGGSSGASATGGSGVEGVGSSSSSDPLTLLENALGESRPLTIPGVILPAFTGGAVGYVGYDCVRFFEPRVAPSILSQPDFLGIPDALFMLVDTVVVFDHVRHTIKVISYARLPERLGCAKPLTMDEASAAVAVAYSSAASVIDTLALCLAGPVPPSSLTPRPAASALLRPAPWSPPRTIPPTTSIPSPPTDNLNDGQSKLIDWTSGSNVGKEGYESMVRNLKGHIVEGDIIQAVPSQRISIDIPPKCTASAFDIYRQLRILNPSPYMFYLECDGLVVRRRRRGREGGEGRGGGEERRDTMTSPLIQCLSLYPPPPSPPFH